MKAALVLDNSNSTATLTLVGPNNKWFALSFGDFNQGMNSGVDIVYFNGTSLIDAIKIYDFQGKLIENKNFEIPLSNYYQFDFSKKEKGIYFMELITNGKSSWEKIIFE